MKLLTVFFRYLLLIAGLLSGTAVLGQQTTVRCAAWEIHQQKMLSDEAYRLHYQEAQAAIRAMSAGRTTLVDDTVLVIPVVVHVLYNTPEQNISNEQIQSQIDVLNEDYAGLNATSLDVPAIWSGMVKDSHIRFKLAVTDPAGNYSTGITRTYTDHTEFQLRSPDIFHTVDGGYSAWPCSDYLNIWVCNLADNVLGFAAFPGGLPEMDGVVISTRSFGRKGTVTIPYNLGRSCSHEVGHWLNLIHIWGDTDDCQRDDFIEDTPLQTKAHFRCPSFPNVDSCTAVAPGVMYMNYMDYSDDKCMMFFTPDQDSVMRETMKTWRATVRQSQALDLPPTAPYDLAVDSILTPVRSAANQCFEPIVRIANNSKDTVHSYTLYYSIYNENAIQKSYTFSGMLLPHSTHTDTLPAISSPYGNQVLEVRISSNDSNTVNNYHSAGFKMTTAAVSNCNSEGLLVYPNPAVGVSSVCVKAESEEAQLADIRLFDATGRLVYHTVSQVNPGDAFPVPLQVLQSGVYCVQVDGSAYTKTARIVYLRNGDTVTGPSVCN